MILFLGVYLVNTITESKIEKVRSLETGIAINILSIETQFALLQELSCKNISRSILSSELDALAQKLQFMENNLNPDDPELLRLKKYYFLLEIKDFILLQKINKKCGGSTNYILYFYSNEGNCKKCKEQGYILSRILKKRDDIRVYNFDYDIELSALDALKQIYNVSGDLPILIINGKRYNKLMTEEDIYKLIPEPKANDEDDENNEKSDGGANAIPSVKKDGK